MPMIARGKEEFTKFRLLLSGLPNKGKTTSLPTFLYGPYSYWLDSEHDEAVEYAGQKKMVIISVPGETGYRSLPPDTENLTSYYFETNTANVKESYQSSIQAIQEFNTLYEQVEKSHPDILCIDGASNLYDQIINKTSQGRWLRGEDVGDNIPEVARIFSQSHNGFKNYLSTFYSSPIPFVIVTCWEDWQESRTGDEKPNMKATRFLWPSLPGKMATQVVGRFDARISACIRNSCVYPDCKENKKHIDHFVWQFYPAGDVQGVGIKGLKLNNKMKETPYIHQNWDELKDLIYAKQK